MNQVGDFLAQVQRTVKGDRDFSLLVPVPANRYVVQLNLCGSVGREQVQQAVQQRNFFAGEWPVFNDLVVCFVELCNQLNAFSAYELYDLYAAYLETLSSAFAHKKWGVHLGSVLCGTVAFVLPLAAHLDEQLLKTEHSRRPRLTHLALVLLKVFNGVRLQLGSDKPEAKRAVVVFVGGALCRVYFKLGNPLLCRNVFSNMDNAGLRLRDYPVPQQWCYRYHLARFLAVKGQLPLAAAHFEWCLVHLPTNCVGHANVRRLLRQFIPVALAVGRVPNFGAVQHTFFPNREPFLNLYANLAAAVGHGDLARVHVLVVEHSRFLKRHKLLLLVRRLVVVALRNLVRRVWLLSLKKLTLAYNDIAAALRVLLGEMQLSDVATLGETQGAQVTDEDVENCLVTLIDLNLVKGKIFARQRAAALSKTAPFPSVAEIYALRFGAKPDKWMA